MHGMTGCGRSDLTGMQVRVEGRHLLLQRRLRLQGLDPLMRRAELAAELAVLPCQRSQGRAHCLAAARQAAQQRCRRACFACMHVGVVPSNHCA